MALFFPRLLFNAIVHLNFGANFTVLNENIAPHRTFYVKLPFFIRDQMFIQNLPDILNTGDPSVLDVFPFYQRLRQTFNSVQFGFKNNAELSS